MKLDFMHYFILSFFVQKLKNARLKEILDEGAKVHPKDKDQNQYLLNEERICKKSRHILKAYFFDGW